MDFPSFESKESIQVAAAVVIDEYILSPIMINESMRRVVIVATSLAVIGFEPQACMATAATSARCTEVSERSTAPLTHQNSTKG